MTYLMPKSQRGASTLSDPRWAAVVARDADADGQFYYGVSTTGVYCRPSCHARLARPENVSFHETCEAAERAGFRACRRCRPGKPSLSEENAATVAAVCRAIDAAESVPTLAELAAVAGLSSAHFHRMFRAVIGLTPRQYADASRARRLREKLSQSTTVTSAIHDAGYNTSSRFYEAADNMLGMAPARYRAGGAATTITFAVGECALGSVLVAQSERGVCAILMGDDPDGLVRDLQDRFPRSDLIGGDAAFESLVASVVGFVEAPQLGLDLPLDIRGTAFQQRVWRALQSIPVGQTRNYTELAELIGAPQAVRAVASACAANALAVAIPCHRVVRRDGGLSGYRWGVERKRALIATEAAAGKKQGAEDE